MNEASFERINYSIRPAKAAQRRMLIEAFGRLAPIHPLSQYQYIGFGSTFFLDFKMVHRQYGIKQLRSLEREDTKRRRFDFNKPFSCIKMYYGTAAEFFISSEMKWKRPAIIWLDYDYRFSESVQADIDRVLEKARPGTLLVVTVDAEPPRMAKRRNELEKEIDLAKLLDRPRKGVGQLSGDKLGDAYWRRSKAEIESTLRNSRPECSWRQLFNFRYADGRRMLTFGGLLVDGKVKKALKQCRFKELPYVKSGEEPFEIVVPNLTGPEIHKVAQHMPNLTKRNRESLTRLAISEEDILNYKQLYRHLPQFVESQA